MTSERQTRAARPADSPRLRVMQSFKKPRSTTNPYIVMLDAALAADPSVEHVTFSWRDALLSPLDAIHFHWPEILLEGDRPWKRGGKRALLHVLLLKLRLQRVAVIRTVHNVELPSGIAPATRRLLEAIEARTDHRILLNATTPVPTGAAATVLPHGHYRDWFARFPRSARVPGRVGYFGLIRRYKGVETLISAYESAVQSNPDISLRLGGKPSAPELAAGIDAAAERLPGLSATLRFLDDGEIVEIASESELVVLPYRFMHNSGGALAALSLDRPVLLPRNEVNEALSDEVGSGWVHLYDGELDADRLRAALHDATDVSGSPDLSHREWSGTGAALADVYRAAVTHRRRP